MEYHVSRPKNAHAATRTSQKSLPNDPNMASDIPEPGIPLVLLFDRDTDTGQYGIQKIMDAATGHITETPLYWECGPIIIISDDEDDTVILISDDEDDTVILVSDDDDKPKAKTPRKKSGSRKKKRSQKNSSGRQEVPGSLSNSSPAGRPSLGTTSAVDDEPIKKRLRSRK